MAVEIFDLEMSGFVFRPGIPALTRKRTGNEAFHDAAFDAGYDFHTLIYDCWFDPRDQVVYAVCPAMMNFKRLLADTEFRIDGQVVTPAEVRHLSRCSVIVLPSTGGQALTLQHVLFGGTLAIGQSYADAFAGLNGIYSISKNNRLEWIQDWLDYYVRVHGCNAVVLADNGSTDYAPADLRAAIAEVPGLEKAAILRARYPFGPTAENNAAYSGLFLQRSLAEIGRLRFWPQARAVLNADIDELFHSRAGRSIFDATVASPDGYLRGEARWVYAKEPGPEGFVRHADHGFITPDRRPKANRKWCVVPDGPQAGKQWLTHFINDKNDPVDDDFMLWHFRQISTSWKFDRAAAQPDLIADPDLQAAMLAAFPDRRG